MATINNEKVSLESETNESSVTWTVGQIVRRIDEMAASSNPSLAAHGQSLKGPRTRGSTTEHGLDHVWMTSNMEEFTPPESKIVPGCRYFKFEASELLGRVGAVSLEHALKRAAQMKQKITVRMGTHGYELVLDNPAGVLERTDTITVVVGIDETGTFPWIVWTWHPGELLAPCLLAPDVAVKTHNG